MGNDNELNFFADVSKMSDDELRVFLEEIRLKRKTGFTRKPRKKAQLDIPDEIAESIMAELKQRGLI